MAGAHVAHDCTVGNHVVIANNVLVAGHVSIGDYAFIGGGAAIHQNARIGESVMVGGMGRVSRDLAPYTMMAERDEVCGLNLVGLRRRGFPTAVIAELKEAYRAVYFGRGSIRVLAGKALESGHFTQEESRRFLSFFSGGKRNFARAVPPTTAQKDENAGD
jgi:UDP-N-acetylglucosamine acyltransferase